MKKDEKNKIVQLKPIYHHGIIKLGIFFEYDKSITDIVRGIEGCLWSGIHMCWYMAFTQYNLQHVEEIVVKKARVHNFFKPDNRFMKGKYVRKNQGKYSQSQFVDDSHETSNRKYLEKFSKWMMSRAYSKATVKNYTETLRVFFEFLGSVSAEKITSQDVLRFNREVIVARNLSPSFQPRLLYVLALFFRRIQGKDMEPVELEMQKKKQKVPGMLERGQVARILRRTKNLKHRILVAIVYSAGLKLHEALGVRLQDIDSNQMTLLLKKDKGIPARILPLSVKFLDLYKEYYLTSKPKEYLFEGKFGEKYTERSAQLVLKNIVKKAGIKKKVSYQMLRHSHIVHMLESGAEWPYLQNQLGSVSKRGYEIYRKIRLVSVQKTPNPLDELVL